MRRNWLIGVFLLGVPGIAQAAPAQVTAGSASSPLAEVVGGAQVAPGGWLDAAGIIEGNGVVCTGVLVAPNLVLTAGHCSGNIDAVILGTNDYTTGGEVIAVTREIAYPRWWQSYDAAILVLERDSTIQPRMIADGCIRDTYTKDGAAVAIVGYGAIDQYGREYTSELREAFTTVTDADCSSIERGCVSSISPNGEIGAGGMGIDSCYGDSGGPLYLLTPSGDFLVGLTSRAWDDVNIDCAEGGIYVRPDALITWIETETGVDLPEATCNLAPLPTAERITAEVGGSGSTNVSPNDPDAGDSHTYAIGQQPAHGTAEVSADGTVTFTSTDDFVGADELTVMVTDSGSPGLTGQVVVLIDITEGGGCGCRGAGSEGGAGAVLLLGLVAVAIRRRRPSARSES